MRTVSVATAASRSMPKTLDQMCVFTVATGGGCENASIFHRIFLVSLCVRACCADFVILHMSGNNRSIFDVKKLRVMTSSEQIDRNVLELARRHTLRKQSIQLGVCL